ncbi:MAG: hypothetical protein ACYTG6_16880 [Planctomycetota bacterium]|jgi:hypothetical protein
MRWILAFVPAVAAAMAAAQTMPASNADADRRGAHWQLSHWHQTSPAAAGGSGDAASLVVGAGPTWNHVGGARLEPVELNTPVARSAAQSASGVYAWTVVGNDGDLWIPSWELSATAAGAGSVEVEAGISGRARAAVAHELVVDGHAWIHLRPSLDVEVSASPQPVDPTQLEPAREDGRSWSRSAYSANHGRTSEAYVSTTSHVSGALSVSAFGLLAPTQAVLDALAQLLFGSPVSGVDLSAIEDAILGATYARAQGDERGGLQGRLVFRGILTLRNQPGTRFESLFVVALRPRVTAGGDGEHGGTLEDRAEPPVAPASWRDEPDAEDPPRGTDIESRGGSDEVAAPAADDA